MLNAREIKKAFYAVPKEGADAEFVRMRYFTEFAISKNPVEYSRRYIDEKTERSDVVGYAAAISYSFDDYEGDSVLEDMKNIAEKELVGSETHRDIVLVDFSKKKGEGYAAKKRSFAVIPEGEGENSETYTYSGTLKAAGEAVFGIAQIKSPQGGNAEDVQSITFKEDSQE